MYIVEENFSEDCFDGNFIKEFTLNKKLSKDWICYLEKFGKMTCLDNLENPFYSFDKEYFFTIKGVLNNNKVKVIFRRNNMEYTMDFFKILIENFEKTDDNINIVKEIEKKISNKINIK